MSSIDTYVYELSAANRFKRLTVDEIKHEMHMALKMRYTKKHTGHWSQIRGAAQNLFEAGATELRKRGRSYEDDWLDDNYSCNPTTFPTWVEVTKEKANEILKKQVANNNKEFLKKVEGENQLLVFYYGNQKVSNGATHYYYSYIAKRELRSELKYFIEKNYLE